MVDIIITVVLEVAKCLAPPLARRFDYLRNYKTNFDKLDQEVGKLKDARNQVQCKVDTAVVEKIKPEVEEWQNNVKTVIDEAEMLIEEKTNNRCFCPNLRKRYKQSKEALRKVEVITELLQEKKRFDKVSDPTTHEPIWLTSRNKDYEDFQSRSETLKDIWTALRDANIPVIGVHGMGGIGKTTLAKEIGRQAKDAKLFDDVVFVEITDNPNIKYIQQEIAGYLGLSFPDNDTESQRASMLFARLKNEKKILLILDNIWTDLNLEEVGILFGDDQKECKLLLTARHRNVLENMGSRTFHIASLGEEEAWRLFKKSTDDYIETQEFKSLANDVVKQCGGLPIAIVTVAKALRSKRHQSQWKEALRRLKRSSPTKFEGEYAKAYKCIELSYNYLRDDELKKTFLLCCLIRPDASILDLLKYGIGLDIFQSTYTMEEARDEVDALIHDLKDSSLLLDHQDHQRFSIHDFVREVAVSIAIREENVFYVRNDTQWEWPRKDNDRKIFITNDNFSEFPNELECPQLDSLFMMENSYWRRDSLVKIPEKFFTKLVNLQVLDLIGMQLPSLSSSLHPLVNIQTLSLYYCKFEDIAIIGELKKLKILILRYSNFEQLPSEIGQLVHLRLLDLSYSRQLKVIAPEVIKSLSQLEELCMGGCPVQWENACLEELSHLSKLTSLEIDIKDEILPKDFFAKKLERYKISIGSGFDYPFDARRAEERSRRALKLKLSSSICLKESQSIKNVEFLYLDALQGVANDILSELGKDGFSQLKHLCWKNNDQFMCIVDSTNLVARDAFPALELLYLSGLSNLEKICLGQFTTESFCKLKSIKVEKCDKLKNLSFPFSTATGFQRIQKIEVSSCKNMEEIFVTGGEDGVDNNNEVIDKIDFSEMQSVTLEDLPQLTSFYSRTSVKTPKTLTSSEALSNEIVPEDALDTAPSLFNEKVVFPKLEILKLNHMNFEKIWDSQFSTMSSSCKNLTRLILNNCQKLKSVFSSSQIKVLVQLQQLEISECNVLKEIIAEGGGAEEAKFEFPRVTYLRLWKLQELRTFYPRIHTSEWPMLKTLEIGYCDKVKIFSSEYEEESHLDISRQQPLFLVEKVVFAKLEVLELKAMNFEKICDSQFLTMSSPYKNLTRLILNNCQKLKSVFSSSEIKVLVQLQHLEISECNALKEIIAEGGGAEEAKFEFPRVTLLKLWKLQELTSFYPRIHTSEWPVLKKLVIGYCDKVKIFSSEYEEESNLDISRQQPLFLAEKINPNLEDLTLSGKNIALVCKGQFSKRHFSKLKVTIEGDESINIPLAIPKNLEKLCLSESSYEEIFSNGENEIDDRRPIQIKFLEISWLSDLKNMWKHDSKLNSLLQNLEILEVDCCDKLITVVPPSASFQSLTTLEVSSSDGLTSLISSSTAKSLEQLREMKIGSCNLMVEVVANEEHVEKDEIVFNKLKLLSLTYLNTLISFCSGDHTFKFPSLEELIIEECPNMKYFSGGVLKAPNLQKVKLFKGDVKGRWEGDLNKTVQQLHKTVVNSNSEKLTLSGDDIQLSRQGQFPEHCSSVGLTVLEVIKDESSNIPHKVLQRFNNLEKLILKLSSYKEIFSSEEGDSVLQNLKFLAVQHCHNLKILGPSSASFENLTTLKVCYCDGLRNLVTAATAKGLVRLEEMIIDYCDLMIEVVENREDEARDDEIVFNKLKSLSLNRLESLTRFCSGNYTFNFPALETLRVVKCPKMKVFSEGVLSTPKLHNVKQCRWDDEEVCWEGDVNTTIQELYKKVNDQISEKDLTEASTQPPV